MQRTIAVKGVGSVSKQPDQVEIYVTLEARDMEYARAVSKADESIARLVAAVQTAGHAKNVLKTTEFSINALYDGEHDERGNYRQVFAGYQCTEGFRLKFELDRELLSKTLGAITNCEANPQLNIAFSVKDRAALTEALLKNAAENARKRAEILAAASGVRLGEIIEIDYDFERLLPVSATNFRIEKRMMDYAGGAQLGADVEPESIEVSDSARFVWSIE